MNTEIPWETLSEVYGFLGNSLLRPMSQTSPVGLEAPFWKEFPSFDDAQVAAALDECAQVAARVTTEAEAQAADPVQKCSVEYTRLFVGPPAPAAPPWETMYRGKEVTVGFGRATFEMRALLREAGLELRNENNQYEDHMGIELLYLSVMCSRLAGGATEDAPAPDAQAVAAYLDAHPLTWADAFRDRVAKEAPGGYFAALISLACAVLAWHRAQLA